MYQNGDSFAESRPLGCWRFCFCLYAKPLINKFLEILEENSFRLLFLSCSFFSTCRLWRDNIYWFSLVLFHGCFNQTVRSIIHLNKIAKTKYECLVDDLLWFCGLMCSLCWWKHFAWISYKTNGYTMFLQYSVTG